MKKSGWKDTAELIGIAAIVASLVFVGFQLRQDQHIAQAQVFSDYGESHTAWVELVTTNADVWVRGLNADELSNTEAAQFDAMAVGYWVQQRSKYLRSIRLAGRPDFIITDTANFIYQHEGLRLWFKKWRDYSVRRGGDSANSAPEFFFADIVESVDGMASGDVTHVPNNSYMPTN